MPNVMAGQPNIGVY